MTGALSAAGLHLLDGAAGAAPASIAGLSAPAAAAGRVAAGATDLIRTDPDAVARAADASATAAPPQAPAPSLVPQPARPRPVVVAPRKAMPASCSSGPAAQTLQLINGDRAQAGLAPLALDAGLCQAAQWHSAQNAAQDTMTHNGLFTDVSNAGVHYSVLGEVLGYCRPAEDPGFVNGMWMQSQEHHDIIDDSRFLRVGIGWAESSNGDWFVSAIVDA